MIRKACFALFMLCLHSSTGACSPSTEMVLAGDSVRIKRQFDAAETVVLARAVEVRAMVYGVAPKPERVDFVVERSFKGRLRPGDKFVVQSEPGNTCARSVYDFLPMPPRTKNRVPAKRGRAYPMEWLLYIPPPKAGYPFEITDDETSSPLEMVSADVPVLERHWAGGSGRSTIDVKRELVFKR